MALLHKENFEKGPSRLREEAKSAGSNFIGSTIKWLDSVWQGGGARGQHYEVTDPEFWPHIISQCRKDWRCLEDQPGIPRLLRSFDSKTMRLAIEVPTD